MSAKFQYWVDRVDRELTSSCLEDATPQVRAAVVGGHARPTEIARVLLAAREDHASGDFERAFARATLCVAALDGLREAGRGARWVRALTPNLQRRRRVDGHLVRLRSGRRIGQHAACAASIAAVGAILDSDEALNDLRPYERYYWCLLALDSGDWERAVKAANELKDRLRTAVVSGDLESLLVGAQLVAVEAHLQRSDRLSASAALIEIAEVDGARLTAMDHARIAEWRARLSVGDEATRIVVQHFQSAERLYRTSGNVQGELECAALALEATARAGEDIHEQAASLVRSARRLGRLHEARLLDIWRAAWLRQTGLEDQATYVIDQVRREVGSDTLDLVVLRALLDSGGGEEPKEPGRDRGPFGRWWPDNH